MTPPSSDPQPDPEQIEQALETGRVSPEQARTAFYTRQQAVDEKLRALAEIQPPAPEPSVTSTWQHTVRYASQQQDLTDEGAAMAESILSGEASPREFQVWEHEAARHPTLAAAARRAALIDRTLARLPEVARPEIPPLILEQLRHTLASALAPAPAPVAPPRGFQHWWKAHPFFTSVSLGAAAAVAVASLNPTWNLGVTPVPGPGIAVTAPAPPASDPEPAPAAPATETASLLPDPAEPVPAPLVAKVPEPVTETPTPTPEPESEPVPPPAGSMEALRPVYLAQLTGGITRLTGEDPILRSGEETAIGSDLQVTFRSVGSSDLQDTGNEQFAALAAVLNDPALADEPYFIIEDHSHSDVDVSYRRAQAVCQLLTKYGVKTSRLRPGGKGRFELRPEDLRDGPSSRITIRPGSVIRRLRSTGYIDRLGRDFDPVR